MSKAEEKTTELMKKAKDFIPDGGYSEKELNLAFFMFIKGYHQAEKDLEHFENFVNSMQEESVNKVDVDAAMSEVEAKAKTFTESHKGESSDKILAQMRGEEPVSEDLEKASKEWLEPQLDKSYVSYGEGKMMELTHFDGYAMLDAIEFGAQWKEQQLEKNRLARCDAQTEEEAEREQEFVMQHIKKYHCQPTFSDAIEWGMNRQKEQLMAKAVEWIKEHKEVVETEDNGIMGWIPDYFIEDFKNFLNEE